MTFRFFEEGVALATAPCGMGALRATLINYIRKRMTASPQISATKESEID